MMSDPAVMRQYGGGVTLSSDDVRRVDGLPPSLPNTRLLGLGQAQKRGRSSILTSPRLMAAGNRKMLYNGEAHPTAIECSTSSPPEKIAWRRTVSTCRTFSPRVSRSCSAESIPASTQPPSAITLPDLATDSGRLHAAGFTDKLLSPAEDRTLLSLGYGLTNVVAGATARGG